ncbi:UDP-glycosyltransferase 73C1 isoform X1 [Hevea brasiliensis]|uniref:UDP-glycosyltransferase 73C1 isoform X1 n=1 Tax=Hevea brasiliensis TaxID=3981 RepID=UPI0025EB4B3A|nr:UDP-glycosyltransferase 73C1 isoform X1 [Hevea brasiliensis]
MASKSHQLHFILFPYMAQGHMIPMVDIARLLAQHGMIITIVTTPLNSKRFASTLARAVESGLEIHLLEVPFPSEKAGLPKECENIDMLPSLGLGLEFASATNLLQETVERLLKDLKPRPNCIISDMCLPYTSRIASKFQIPRIVFNGFGCFSMMCLHRLYKSQILESITSKSEYFEVPGLPDHILVTKEQLPEAMHQSVQIFNKQVIAAEIVTYGIIFNSFEELEPAYVQEFKKARGDKVWCVGPVSLCNKHNLDKLQRGDKASVDEYECLKWLNSQKPGSVLYVCFGSLCNLITSQLIEIGLALEASNIPFIWVLRGGGKSTQIEKINGRGLLIRGWAPQVAILSHAAVGGFLTHCGWNSTLEGICAGKPMITWPLFADQFLNERLVVDVSKIGVKAGTEVTVPWGEEEKIGVLVKKKDVNRAIERLMDGGEESEERRKRAKELSRMAKGAIEPEGSSYVNMEMLIQDIMQQIGLDK